MPLSAQLPPLAGRAGCTLSCHSKMSDLPDFRLAMTNQNLNFYGRVTILVVKIIRLVPNCLRPQTTVIGWIPARRLLDRRLGEADV